MAELLSRKHVFRGRVLEVNLDRVRLPGGKEAVLELIRHPGAAAVVPLHGDGSVTLVRQHRPALDADILEVPAGKLSPDESPADCARRELEEETGLVAGELRELGFVWSTPGFTDERIHLFVATELGEGRQDLQDDEVLDLVRVGFDEALAMVARGDIRDAKSVCALLRLDREGRVSPSA